MKKKLIISIITCILLVSGTVTIISILNIQRKQEILNKATVLNQESNIYAIDNTVSEELLTQENAGFVKAIACEFIWFNDLLDYVSANELQVIEERLQYLFTVYFHEVALIGDIQSYYRTQSSQVELLTGISNYKDFDLLHEKTLLIPAFERCQIRLQPESLVRGEEKYYMDIEVVFDQTFVMEFSLSIDERTFETFIN